MVGIVLVESRPHPWFICGVEDKSILWATLIHYLSLLPEHWTFVAVAQVKAEAVNTFKAPQQLALISLMGRRALPAVGALGNTISTLMAKLVAPETSYWLLVRALGFDAFVKYVRTLFEDCVCRFWALVEYA